MGKHVWRRGRRPYPSENLRRSIWEEGEGSSLPPFPPERRRRGRREDRPRRWWPVVLLLVLLLMAGAGWWTYRWLTAPPVPPGEGRLNILVMGTDAGELNSRADTIMLFSLDMQNNTISILSIPRDTRIRLPGQEEWSKINAVNTMGPQMMLRVVKSLTGVPVEHYVRASFEGFAAIIDTLGGVVIDVEKPMHYDDFAQGLHIHLEPGRQWLSGQEALGYLRFRHDGLGDVTAVDPENQVYEGRVERQQKFIAAVAHQFLQPGVLFRLPRLIGQLQGAVDTDLNLPQMFRYLMALKKMQGAAIRTFILPGESVVIDRVSYWEPNQARIPQVVAEFLGEKKITASTSPPTAVPSEGVSPAETSAEKVVSPSPAGAAQEEYQPVVEILNGSGVQGMAARAAKVFKARGFRVVRVENADRQDYVDSQVIIRSDRITRLEEITNLIRDPAFIWKLDPKSKIDLTIILSRKSGF